MPKIPVYEQQTSPNASQMPTEMPAYGQATARATGQLANSVNRGTEVVMQWQEEKAKVLAEEVASRYQVSVSEAISKHEQGLKIEEDPEEAYGKLKSDLKAAQENIIAENDKPFLKKFVKERIAQIQRGVDQKIISNQAQAQGRYIGHIVNKTLDNYTKSAIIDGTTEGFLEAEKGAYDSLDKIGGAAAGEDVKRKWSADTAAAILAKINDKDPEAAKKILADKEHPLTKRITADQYEQLDRVATKGAQNVEAADKGDNIGRGAFDSHGEAGASIIKEESEKASGGSPVMAQDIERNARAAFTQAKAENDARVNAERDRMFDATARGESWTPPSWLHGADLASIDEQHKRQVENLQNDAEGFRRSSDEAYLNQVIAAASAQDKTEFVTTPLDKTRLSRRDYDRWNQARIKMSGDRTATEGEIGPAVDRYIDAHKFPGSSQQQKERIAAIKGVMLDLVAAKEKEAKRKISKPEMDAAFAEAFGQTAKVQASILGFEMDGATKSAIDLINPKTATIISGAIKDAGGIPSPKYIVQVQQDIERKRDLIESRLSESGTPISDENVYRYYLDKARRGEPL